MRRVRIGLIATILVAAWAASAAVAQTEEDDVSSAELLRSGLEARTIGDVDAAREALASIRPVSPEYAWARYHLAVIALREGDAALARRYLDTADKAPRPVAAADVLALRWEMNRIADPDAARRHERELAHRFPESLALARVRELQRSDSDLSGPDSEADHNERVGDSKNGDYSLQLGAFRDRGRAMTFRDAWVDHIPDLIIVEDQDDAGAPIYRLRSGHFQGRIPAEAAAEQLRRRHELEPLVVETDPRP